MHHKKQFHTTSQVYRNIGYVLTVTNNGFFRYTYKLGHRLFNGSYIWSKIYSFKSSPYPGQDSLQQVVIFGDMGKVLYIILEIYWVDHSIR